MLTLTSSIVGNAAGVSSVKTITDQEALFFSDLAYVNFRDNQINKTIWDIKNDTNVKERVSKNVENALGKGKKRDNFYKSIKDWKLILYSNDNAGFTGFGSAVFENISKNQVIVAYRGTDKNWQDIFKEDKLMISKKDAFQTESPQRRFAERVAAIVFVNRPKSNVYFVGHSLGGTLAQTVAFEATQKTLDDNIKLPILKDMKWSKAQIESTLKLKKKLKSLEKQYPNQVKGLITFNAPGIFKTKSSFIKYSSKYKFAKHYIVNKDPVGELWYSLGYGDEGKIKFKRIEPYVTPVTGSPLSLINLTSHPAAQFYKYKRIYK